MSDLELSRLKEALSFIPADSYDDWCMVGMAIKDSDESLLWLWDDWSRTSPKYKPGDCAKKWTSFRRADGDRVTLGTVYELAKEHGWKPPELGSRELQLGEVLQWIPEPERRPERPITRGLLPLPPPPDPETWDRAADLDRYLQAVFRSGETICYVMAFWADEGGRYNPARENHETADSILERLGANPDHVELAIGEEDPNNGAQVRINPVRAEGPSGKMYSDADVTAYRYTLIEADDMPIEEQWAQIQKLRLPCAAVVHSGGKSLHAIVHLDARGRRDYDERRRFLADMCAKAGFRIDRAASNPSRLSRLPGVMRGGTPQYLVATDIGFRTYFQWRSWVQETYIEDTLPEIVKLSDMEGKLPPLAPELITGVLRQGHKMLVAGPSKAGKSHLLAELAVAIATGREWCGHKCVPGPVMYINLEVDDASWLHIMEEISHAMGLSHLPDDVYIWPLRGHAEPMDVLEPKIKARLRGMGQFLAVIIDPIYKVITGDENSATDMAKFVNLFDDLCKELKTSVIYCHHHSKGAQTGKRAIDRSSGSGVFGRDPDAIVDLTEIPEDQLITARNELFNQAGCQICCAALKEAGAIDEIRDFDFFDDAMGACRRVFYDNPQRLDEIQAEYEYQQTVIQKTSAWRVEMALREFATPDPVDLWYTYPIHSMDMTGQLRFVNVRREPQTKSGGRSKMEENLKTMHEEFGRLSEDGEMTASALSDALHTTMATLKNWVAKSQTLEWVKQDRTAGQTVAKIRKKEQQSQV